MKKNMNFVKPDSCKCVMSRLVWVRKCRKNKQSKMEITSSHGRKTQTDLNTEKLELKFLLCAVSRDM